MNMALYEATQRRFVAGFETQDGKVTTCAPVIAWIKGKGELAAKLLLEERGWKVRLINAKEKG